MVRVTDEQLKAALIKVLERNKQLVEPSGVAGLCAIENNLIPDISGKNVVCIISGGNIETTLLHKIIGEYLDSSGDKAEEDSCKEDLGEDI